MLKKECTNVETKVGRRGRPVLPLDGRCRDGAAKPRKLATMFWHNGGRETPCIREFEDHNFSFRHFIGVKTLLQADGGFLPPSMVKRVTGFKGTEAKRGLG